jgi:hypothetical protein
MEEILNLDIERLFFYIWGWNIYNVYKQPKNIWGYYHGTNVGASSSKAPLVDGKNC